MRCRPATRDDIPEMTRIITEGFLDYPLHIMLKPYLYQPDRYPRCLAAINRMLASSYQWVRHALVVEHEGRVVATLVSCVVSSVEATISSATPPRASWLISST